jgi:hypothetical protein
MKVIKIEQMINIPIKKIFLQSRFYKSIVAVKKQDACKKDLNS